MSSLTASVLVPSRRPMALVRCLQSLALQTRPPEEVIVVWQGDDIATRDAALSVAERFGTRLHVLHAAEVGIVPSENAALAVATGDIILLIDDDAVAEPDWLARHIAHYADSSIGAVGGPAYNFRPDGTPFPRRDKEPIGRFHWWGRLSGNMYDQVESWRGRGACDVDHLVGYNFSLRRTAFGRFEDRLKPYWQFFEFEACLQVSSRGYRVVFDYGIVVEHHPTNVAFVAGRDGDLTIKCFNPAYNHAFILGRYVTGVRRWACLFYMFGVGATGMPGLVAWVYSTFRYGQPLREWGVLKETMRNRLAGWRDGTAAARSESIRKGVRPLAQPGLKAPD